MSNKTAGRRSFIKSAGMGVAGASALAAFRCPWGQCQEPGSASEKSKASRRPKPEAKAGSGKGKAEQAVLLLQEHYNCCTAVLAAYATDLVMSEELAVRATRGMPGIGMLGNVCGVVSGAAMVIGLRTTSKDNIRDRRASHETYELIREFVARFEDRHSFINCSDLLGRDVSSCEKFQAATKDNAFANCPRFVESAVHILEELFDNGEKSDEEASQD